MVRRDVIQVLKLEPRIMRYELSEYEWSGIKPMRPNKPRGVPHLDDRRVLNGILWVQRLGAVARSAGELWTYWLQSLHWTRGPAWSLQRGRDVLIGPRLAEILQAWKRLQ
jgi:transposase